MELLQAFSQFCLCCVIKSVKRIHIYYISIKTRVLKYFFEVEVSPQAF